MPIIGIGGITTGADALELLLAGASAVQVGTANFHHPDVIADVATEVGRFLEKKGLSSPADLTGRVRAGERVPEPAQPL